MTLRDGVLAAFGQLVGDAQDDLKCRMVTAAYEVVKRDSPQLADAIVQRGVEVLALGDEQTKPLVKPVVLCLFEADRLELQMLIDRGRKTTEAADPLKKWSQAFESHPSVADDLGKEIAKIVQRTKSQRR